MTTTTHNVDIRFRESGARVIKRKMDDIGTAANNATRGIFLMQRALFVLGGAGILTGIVRQLDLLTNYENRLRLTATSAANLESVQRKLFNVANDSRTSFEAVAEIYTRTALSVRELGVSQAETIAFTERLAKATIISGASAREAHAALIQLGQGMASNTLRGDELRSVLEQLPYVADIIARSLGITRGELREFGAEGKISAETVLKAFREAGAEIDALFAQTIPTIGQALTVFGNQIQQTLDKFDDATGFSSGVAQSIIAVANALDEIVVASTVAVALLAGLFADKLLGRITRSAKAHLAYAAAVKSGNIVLLNSTTAESARSASLVRAAAADAQSTAATYAKLQARSADLAVQKAALQQTVLDTQFQVINGQARTIATGQFVNLTLAKENLARVSQKLSIVEAAETATNTRLTAARIAATGATSTLTAANARLTAATAAASTITARLAATFPLLTRVATAAAGAVRSFSAALIANPLTVLIVAITAAAFALRGLRDASEEVNKSADSTDKVLRSVAEAANIAKEEGRELAEVFDEISTAQLGLQRVEAIDAQRAAIAAVSDQLVGFNALWTDLKTILSADFAFAAAIDQLTILREQLADGTLNIFEFRTKIAELGAEVNNARFTQFIRGLVDSIDKVEVATDQIEILDAVIATMAGTATAAQADLLNMAAGLDSVAGSAGAAAGAIDFFVSKIPAMAKAAKVAGGLKEASTQLASGLADLNEQQRSGELSSLDLIAAQGNLNKLYNEAVSEIDGSAEATRGANKALTTYNQQAQLASKTGLDRTIASATQRYDALKTTLVAAGASTEQLAAAEANYQTIVSAARRDAAAAAAKSGAGKAAAPDLESILSGMRQEVELLQLTNAERRTAEGILGIEKELKRGLTEAEKDLAAATLQSVHAAEMQSSVLQDIIGPREEIIEQQAALNALYDQGRIGLDDYTESMRQMQITADETSGTMFGSFRAAIDSAILSTAELGAALGDVVVGAADSAADAIVEFAKTGKINIREFFFDLFAQITKLIAKQLILKALGGILGSFGGGGSITPGTIPGFAAGGSINPTGPGSTDSQIVSFAKRPDERVDILTPGQQNAQRGNEQGGGGGTTVVQSPPVNVAAVLSPSDIVGAFDNNSEGETMIINILQKNASTVSRIVGR